VRSAKQACSTLLQRGSVGDDLWQRFLRAEKEMEEELRDVVMEVSYVSEFDINRADPIQANALSPKWGQTIFQTANEIAANTQLRKRLDEIQSQATAEKEWWEKKRATIQSEFMKELDGIPTTPAKSSTGKAGSDEDAILVESGGPAVGSMKKKSKK
jgi:translocation protein SEC66